jgi:hypothetical protein
MGEMKGGMEMQRIIERKNQRCEGGAKEHSGEGMNEQIIRLKDYGLKERRASYGELLRELLEDACPFRSKEEI